MHRLSDDELDQQKITRFLDPSHPLCRSDVIWILDWIKKKVAADKPSMLGLSQPLLWKSYCRFAEASMLLIHCQRFSYDETDRLRTLLAEAVSSIRSS
ncbi:hypothetical protein [Paenibacillus roseus]|uniref:Uncharacterized protein n=1 Tax=Paenibacillus roseus TaxID=2798579 RepID=A0A934MMF2_9BACL|nr:hypothetical protein [Paenibacillus roseus]MBJ6363250.1 hypothetical protein [Paenibacillus roseus]